MKEIVVNAISKLVPLPITEIERLLEIPPNPDLGDYAFPCFSLAKELKKNPVEIAKDLSLKINTKDFEKIEAKGPYLNFFINRSSLATDTLSTILKEREKYGSGKVKDKIMVEYETPNTNKPLHIGHLRNAAIGMAISNLLEFQGSDVTKADLFNDRGVHICKAMYALEFLSEKKKPDKKSDHFVGDLYVLFNQKAKDNQELEQKAQEMLQKWEEGDKKTLSLWKKIDKWATEGIIQTDKLFGSKFDVYFRESEFYKKAKPILDKGLMEKALSRDKDGNIMAELEPSLPNKVVQRKDGTSIYITNDIALVPYKFEKYKLDKSIWVVGNEQNLYFQQLFKIFEKLGYPWVEKCKHLSYGMVFLPEGKMKSREGTVVDADDFISEVTNLAKTEIIEREKLEKKQLEQRSLSIALAAIKYMLLKVDISKDMTFNPNESIRFEGDTGPYLLYSYARAKSILRKSKYKGKNKVKIISTEINDKEKALINELAKFPEIVKKACSTLSPNLVANYSFSIAQLFNEFYHASPVIGSENESFRLSLVDAFSIVLKNSLNLLGISVIEKM